MTITTVTCPQCGHTFSPDAVLTHALEEQIRAKVLAESNQALKDQAEQIKELQEKAKQSMEFELKLRKEKRELEAAREKLELEKNRQLDAERAKIREETEKAVLAKEQYKIDEYEKKLADMRKAVEEARRKGSQGSQQLQGEVQELDLENTLRTLYPTDQIEEIKKGELGADIRQIVRTPAGTVCGKILWESKRTKAWSDAWILKLKEDVRRDQAHLGAIATQVMPAEIKHGLGNRLGVWVFTREAVEPLSALLREKLIAVAREKVVAVHKQTKAESLYDYITSPVFTQNVERIVGVYLEMKAQLAKEQANSERGFKQRSTQIDMLLSGMSGIYGEMQGLAGTSLPPIALLE